MKTHEDHQPGGTTTTTPPTTPKAIHPALKKRIDAYYNQEADRLRTIYDAYGVPAEVTARILADLADLIYNTYDGLHVKVADIMILGTAGDLAAAYKAKYGPTPAPLSILYRDYANLAAIVRLERQTMAADPQLQPWYREIQERKRKAGGLVAAYELARHYGTPPRIEDRLGAIAFKYTEFVICASNLFDATAAELMATPTPPELEGLGLPAYAMNTAKEAIVSEIVSIKAFTPQYLGRQGRTKGKASKASKTTQKADAKGSDKQTQDPGDVMQATASTMADKVVTLYQSITSTLAKPIEALKDAPAVIEVGRDAHNYKEAKSLNYIIESLAGSGTISPTRVMQALNALAEVAQGKEDRQLDDGQNVFYVYENLSLYDFTKKATGQVNPNAWEMQEIALALNLISVIRIGHDEDRIIGYTKYTDDSGEEKYKPKIQRFRHYTQMGNVPNYSYKINADGKVEEAGKFSLWVHKIVKTGRRAETTIEIGDARKKPKPMQILQPVEHLITAKELATARRLFPGEDGIRFFNMLLSQSHIKERAAIDQVFNYYGRLQEAKARGDRIKEDAEARIRQEDIADDDLAARIREDALGRAVAEEAKEYKNQVDHRSRDRKRLYKWLDLAAENKIINTPYEVTDARDGTKERGKPAKVITWERYKAEKK